MTTESMTEEARYIVAWTPNNVLVRWPCVVCGGQTEKQDPLAVAYAGSQAYENEIGMVCDECVDGGAAAVVTRLTGQAEHLEAEAAERRRQASASWQFPSEEQTRSAHRQDSEEDDSQPSVPSPLDSRIAFPVSRAQAYPPTWPEDPPLEDAPILDLGVDHLIVDTLVRPGTVTLAASTRDADRDAYGQEFDLAPANARSLGRQLIAAAEECEWAD